MDVRDLHPWDLSYREAIETQRRLAPLVVREGDLPEAAVRLIAGADIAAGRRGGVAVAAVVVVSYPDLEPVETVVVEAPVTTPYIPGLLSFREAPILCEAFRRLRSIPDLLIVDGQGYAHPRRFGLACHLGLLLDLPAIGCAKSRLCGVETPPGPERGSVTPLVDDGEVIGSVVRTQTGVRPVYVSVGHRLSLRACEDWTLRCAPKFRLPEPTRLADHAARERKRALLAQSVSASA
ncbi:MAG TPA: deoxyribonuclease V [Dehalococcoidia bacterium]|nr:deoxyribonuclease V [Dehalococcoidia bacterium]